MSKTYVTKVNKYFYRLLHRCKKCGSKGVLSKHYDKWHIICLGRCTNCTELHRTRLGAIREWNSQAKEQE